MVQWLRLHTASAGCRGLITGQGTEIPHMPRAAAKTFSKREIKQGSLPQRSSAPSTHKRAAQAREEERTAPVPQVGSWTVRHQEPHPLE